MLCTCTIPVCYLLGYMCVLCMCLLICYMLRVCEIFSISLWFSSSSLRNYLRRFNFFFFYLSFSSIICVIYIRKRALVPRPSLPNKCSLCVGTITSYMYITITRTPSSPFLVPRHLRTIARCTSGNRHILLSKEYSLC